jgi:hypothetical protein
MNILKAAVLGGLGIFAIACTAAVIPGGTGGAACTQLQGCCASLPSVEQPSCDEIVTANITIDCQAGVTDYCTSGSGTGSGTGSNSGSSPCAELAVCCATSDEPTACDTVAETGNATDCSSSLLTYCPMAAGSGTGSSSKSGSDSGGGCSALSACCTSSSFPSADSSACTEAVNEYMSLGASGTTACNSALESYTAAGYCK